METEVARGGTDPNSVAGVEPAKVAAATLFTASNLNHSEVLVITTNYWMFARAKGFRGEVYFFSVLRLEEDSDLEDSGFGDSDLVASDLDDSDLGDPAFFESDLSSAAFSDFASSLN